MDNFSDDEKYEVDQILGQRKRKGILEYLVRWKGSEETDNTWEPALNIAVDCAQAIKSFVLSQKELKKSRSKSKTRSTSRSRSSSRSRKTEVTKAGKSSRSRSRGRPKKKEATPPTSPTEEKVEETNVRRSLRQKTVETVAVSEVAETEKTQEVKVVEEKASESQSTLSIKTMSTSNSTSTAESDTPRRSLRSSTLEQREKLEVQRVHNDQRPVREDDAKPRSPIWKIADYIVIVMFVVSVFAAIFLFLEKFVDLENFKQQAFPNFGVLKGRLVGARERVLELCHTVGGHISDAWLYLIEQVKRPETVVKNKPAS